MEEHWRRVVGYEDLYAVSTFGRVISLAKGLILSAKPRFKTKEGRRRLDPYLCVELCRDGTKRRTPVHKLVLTAWGRPRQDGEECRHLDGNPENNRLGNLKWGSYHENRLDWHKHRKRIKLTPELVQYIRGSTKSYRQLAAELGVGKTTIQYAKGFWKLVGVDPGGVAKKD